MNKKQLIRIIRILPIMSLIFSSEISDPNGPSSAQIGIIEPIEVPNPFPNNDGINESRDVNVYQFTNCGKSGHSGPNQSQVDNAYSGTNLEGLVSVVNGIQNWEVPTTGTYTIEVYGAQGGGSHGGLGAKMRGDFELSEGTILKILVGQAGSYSNPMTSGGGGTFVVTSSGANNNVPLIIAGGGGGASQPGAHQNGQSGNNGANGTGGWTMSGQTAGIGGTNGNGGYGSSGTGGGGGGGGFYTNGSVYGSWFTNSCGYGFTNGGQGGNGHLRGGFGGGAGARNNSNSWWGGGAGGGYSGGGGACGTNSVAERAGGAGSYNSGTNTTNESGQNTGHGLVVITAPDQISNSAPTAEEQSIYGDEDDIQTITLIGNDPDGDELTFNILTNPSNGTIVQSYSSVLDFDGSNDYVKLPDFSYLDDMSFSAWFKIDSRNYWERIFDFGKGGQGDIFLTTMGGRTQGNLELTIHPFGQTHTINPGMTCDDGEWHHVVFTYDKGGAGMVLYIDGQNVGSNSYNTHSFSDFGNGQNFYLGKANWNDPYYDGKMEKVGLYNKALSSSEVAAIYSGGSNFELNVNSDSYISAANLIGYWKMNEGTGTTLFDNSGNGNNAIIHNGPNWLTEGSADIITYTPNQNYNGFDSFTYAVSDGEATSEAATVNITLTAVNDLPIITSSPTLDALEESQYNYSINVNDVDGDAISVIATSKPEWLSIDNTNTHSLNFDGIDDYVDLENPSDFDFLLNSDFSISFDFKTLSLSHQTLMSMGDGGANYQNRGIHIYLDDGSLKAQFRGDNESNTTYVSFNYELDEYYHIVFSRDFGESFELWVNGNLIDTAIDIAGEASPFTEERPLLLGTMLGFPEAPGGSAYYYDFLNGNLDKISLWSSIQTENAIRNIMYNDPTNNEIDLVGYWSFNEGSGSILTDQTSNGNDGTITGASWSTDVAYSSYDLTGTPTSSDGGLHNVVLEIDDGNGGVATQSFSIGVAVTHLDITGESGFRILSSPVSGAIFGDLLEELWTQGSDGSDHEGADPNVWTYDNGWVPVEDLNNDVLSAGQGFVVYVFADTDFDGDDDLPVTIDIDGAINETAVSVTANPSQWNLVGNPYGLDVSINQILSDNSSRFNSTVYRLDDANPGYRTHNGTVGDIDQGLIKPFDGFWVQADTEGNIFEFTEQSIRRGSLHLDGGGRSTNNESTGTATFTFTNGEFTSNVYLSFTENGHINLDPADAKQIIPMSPAEHLTSMIHESGKSLSINNLPLELTTDISFDLDVMLLTPNDEGYETQSEQVTMTWDVSDLPEGISLSLVNNGTGQTVNLYGYPSMNVALPSKGGFSFPENLMETYPEVGESQFTLSVYTDIASNDKEDLLVPEEITLHNAYPNPFNPSTIISFDILEMDNVSLNIFDLTGRQVASLINEFMIPGNHQISWNPGLLPSGVYLVELAVGDRSFNQKITYIK